MSTIIPHLDTERWRQMTAGLIDEEASAGSGEQYKDAGTKLMFVLSKAYNRAELDPKNLWNRIGDAVALACEQVDDGDLDRFLSVCLEHVRANHARVASDEAIGLLMAEIVEQNESFRLGLVDYLRTHSYVVLVHGRRMWETYKESKSESQDNGKDD